MKEIPTSTVYLLKRTELAVRNCAEAAFAEVDLTANQFFILMLVHFEIATSAAELSREMGVLPQSMTDLIAPLERSGSIVREPDPENRRILRARLTAAGRKLFERGIEAATKLEEELVDVFGARELSQFNDALSALKQRAEDHALNPHAQRRKRRNGTRYAESIDA